MSLGRHAGEGVGIFVNAEGEELEIEVVNLADSDSPDPKTHSKLFNQLKAFFSANSDSTHKETDPMKELIVNALKAKGKPVDGKTDAELMDAYNQMLAENMKPKEETPEESCSREERG
jgi:hypothetical protein